MRMRFLACSNDANMLDRAATRDVATLREFAGREV